MTCNSGVQRHLVSMKSEFIKLRPSKHSAFKCNAVGKCLFLVFRVQNHNLPYSALVFSSIVRQACCLHYPYLHVLSTGYTQRTLTVGRSVYIKQTTVFLSLACLQCWPQPISFLPLHPLILCSLFSHNN